MTSTLAAFVLALALPQADDAAFYKQIASIDTLQSKAVQTELKVSEAQRTAFNSHATVYNEQTKTLADKFKEGTMPKAEFAQKLSDAQATLHDKVIGELTAIQAKRLGQITLQRAGIIAVVNPVVANRLGMTKAQSTTLAEGLQKTGTTVAEIERSAKEPIVKKYQAMTPKTDEEKAKLQAQLDAEIKEANTKIQPDLLKARKTFEDLVDKTLTAGQKKTWADLKGPEFKVSK